MAVLALLVGCGKPDEPATSTPSATTTGADPGKTTAELEPGQPGEPKDPYVVPDLPPGANKGVTHAPHTFKIAPPKTEGWQPAKDAGDIGKRIDDAMFGVKEAFVVVNMNYDDSGNKLAGRAELKIRDAKQFRLEYYRPETQANLNRVIADGKARIELANGKAKPLPKFQEPKTVAMSAKDVDEWAQNFTSEMLDAYRYDERVWASLIEALRKGVGGYQTTIEEKTASPQGQPRRYVRIVAKTKVGTPTDIEVMVDGVRYLPVAVRVVRKKADGTERKGTWSADWRFGGRHEEKEFAIPKGL